MLKMPDDVAITRVALTYRRVGCTYVRLRCDLIEHSTVSRKCLSWPTSCLLAHLPPVLLSVTNPYPKSYPAHPISSCKTQQHHLPIKQQKRPKEACCFNTQPSGVCLPTPRFFLPNKNKRTNEHAKQFEIHLSIDCKVSQSPPGPPPPCPMNTRSHLPRPNKRTNAPNQHHHFIMNTTPSSRMDPKHIKLVPRHTKCHLKVYDIHSSRVNPGSKETPSRPPMHSVVIHHKTTYHRSYPLQATRVRCVILRKTKKANNSSQSNRTKGKKRAPRR